MSIPMAIRAIAACVLGAVLVAGCTNGPRSGADYPKEAFPEHANRLSHALVAGDADALKMFNDQLMRIEGVTQPQDAYILCLECMELAGSAPPPSLNYYYPTEHGAKPQKFLDAWSAVKGTPVGRKLALTLDQDTGKAKPPACPPAPPVCYTAAWCPGTCDKDRNLGGCQPCQ